MDRMCACESVLFIHAILGCDTTSSLYGIGKGLSLKTFICKEQFKQQAITFSNQLSSNEQIVAAGERESISHPLQWER